MSVVRSLPFNRLSDQVPTCHCICKLQGRLNEQPALEQPLELIGYNAVTKRFELGSEALRTLRTIDTPVACVAVSGRARQGKSYILNQLLGRSTGFTVAPTVRPCTKVRRCIAAYC